MWNQRELDGMTAVRGAATIDGRAYAAELKARVAADVADLAAHSLRAGLATVLVGEDYAARAYERRVRRLAGELGCDYVCERLAWDSEQADAVAAVGKLNEDPRVSGILILRPLPAHISEVELYRALHPLKDIEAMHPVNAGLLALGRPRYIPSTPASVFYLLDRYLADSGRDAQDAYARSNVVVVGRSNNVGKPATLLGFARGATVLSCDVHSYKAGLLYDHTAAADILVVGAGVPYLITGEHVRPGVIAVDVGINPVQGEDGKTHLVGDIDFDAVAARAQAISPVPGGVGPITDVWLLHNTVAAAQLNAHVADAQPSLEGLGIHPDDHGLADYSD